MKISIKQIHRDNKGQVLALVLVFFALGAILLVPDLSLAAGSIKLVNAKSADLNAAYAANAGIEYALSQISTGSITGGVLPSTVNGRTVTVIIGTGIVTSANGSTVYTTYPITSSVDMGNGRTYGMGATAVQEPGPPYVVYRQP